MEEQEFKLRITRAEEYETIAEAPEVTAHASGPAATLDMTADYIDTADLRLLRAGYAFRVRREGERWIATVKADLGASAEGGLHRHREWETEVDQPEPDLGVFDDPQLRDALSNARGGQALTTLFRVTMERRLRPLQLDDGTRAEWAADRGRILAGDREEAVCEVELELKDGSLQPVRDLIGLLRERYSLVPDPRTKFARGLHLAGLTPPEG